jgi:hypothetical protein
MFFVAFTGWDLALKFNYSTLGNTVFFQKLNQEIDSASSYSLNSTKHNLLTKILYNILFLYTSKAVDIHVYPITFTHKF